MRPCAISNASCRSSTPSLLTHEYDKHVQCFGFQTQRFFATALDLRQRITTSPLGDWMRRHAGQRVARADVLAEFDRAFYTIRTDALQLRCSGPADARYLSQLWFTIPRTQLAAFPRHDGLMHAPIAQHNCPAHLRLPAWPCWSTLPPPMLGGARLGAYASCQHRGAFGDKPTAAPSVTNPQPWAHWPLHVRPQAALIYAFGASP
ncbi:MAG: hypothetical protein WBL23_17860 [Salinisphaera sp.]|uniref:hypothetical protein n=1 Tax=Salinisphaera sp. TaxID=1914330 RepID=UPI003C7C9180